MVKASGILSISSRADEEISSWLGLRQGDECVLHALDGDEEFGAVIQSRGFLDENHLQDALIQPVLCPALKVSLYSLYPGAATSNDQRIVNTRFIENFEYLGYECSVCQTHQEDLLAGEMMKTHRFGLARGILNVIVRKDGNAVGACIIDTYKHDRFNWTAQKRFKDYPFLKDYMLAIRRITARPKHGVSKHRIQRACFKFVALFGGHLVKGPVAVLIGNSYDPLPSAIAEGFNVEEPATPGHSFFYWRPVKGFIAEPFKRERAKYLEVLRSFNLLVRRNKQA